MIFNVIDVRKELNAVQSTSRGTLSTAGWYRVAECKSPVYFYNMEIVLIKSLQNNKSETHKIMLNSTRGDKCNIDSYDISIEQNISKFRLTNDGTKLYAEIYYNVSHANPIDVILSNHSRSGDEWQAITPTLTSETVEGVTVTTAYDIPANASPVTDLDLAKYLPLTGGKLTGGLDISMSTPYIDFVSDNAKDYTIRVIEGSKGVLDIMNGDNAGKRLRIDTNSLTGVNTPLHTGNMASHVLPLTGGTINITNNMDFRRASDVVIGVKNTTSDGKTSYISMQAAGAANNVYIGNNDGEPYVIGKTVGYILHTGNSAKVVINKTAPSDESALWVY